MGFRVQSRTVRANLKNKIKPSVSFRLPLSRRDGTERTACRSMSIKKKDFVIEAYNQKKITQQQAGIYILRNYCNMSFSTIGKQLRKNASFCVSEYQTAEKILCEVNLQMTLL